MTIKTKLMLFGTTFLIVASMTGYAFAVDSDPARKSGGADPILVGKWGYIHPGNGYQCANSPNPFDFDNDGYKENMCYWYHPDSKLLFVDFNGNQQLDNGYELLNAKGHISAVSVLLKQPNLCVVHDCYLWQDKNSNIRVDEGELEAHDKEFVFKKRQAYLDGRYISDPEKVFLRISEETGKLRGVYIYGLYQEETLDTMYETQPTYWMKGK